MYDQRERKGAEITRWYDERDEPEPENTGMERHVVIQYKDQNPNEMSYIITHLWFFFSIFAGGSLFLVCRRDRTRFMKSSSTFWELLADVSRNSQPNWQAKSAPSPDETSRSDVLSHLLPTSINMGSPCLTLHVDWWKNSSLSNVNREAIE